MTAVPARTGTDVQYVQGRIEIRRESKACSARVLREAAERPRHTRRLYSVNRRILNGEVWAIAR